MTGDTIDTQREAFVRGYAASRPFYVSTMTGRADAEVAAREAYPRMKTIPRKVLAYDLGGNLITWTVANGELHNDAWKYYPDMLYAAGVLTPKFRKYTPELLRDLAELMEHPTCEVPE